MARSSSSVYVKAGTMSTVSNSVRQRGGPNVKKALSATSPTRDSDANGFLDAKKPASSISSEWDYKIALVVITALAFATRFWGIGHPNEVVFDEVHFGKVRLSLACTPPRACVGNLVSLTLDVNAADSRDFGSLPRIISKELTSSMFIRPLASYCLL